MKVKLLKKIRKRFSIYKCSYDKKYQIKDSESNSWDIPIYGFKSHHDTLESALKEILCYVRQNYCQYSRKYKKVWH